MSAPKTLQKKSQEAQDLKTSILVRRQAIVRFIFSLKKQIGRQVCCIKVLADAASEASSVLEDKNPLLRKIQLLNKMEKVDSREPCQQQHQGLVLSFGTNIDTILSYINGAHSDKKVFYCNLGVICQIIDKHNADASQRENREQWNIMKKERIDHRIKQKEHNHQRNELNSDVIGRIASSHTAETQIAVSASVNLQKILEEPLILTQLFLIILLGYGHYLQSSQLDPPPHWLIPIYNVILTIFIVVGIVISGINLVNWFKRFLKGPSCLQT